MTTIKLTPYHKMMRITQHLLISGQVQGVGFRYFTQEWANRLGLTGWVRNLHDGRVEAILQGQPEKLEEMRKVLQRGPARGDVRSLEVQVVVSQQSMKEFNIVEDGEGPCLKK